jgi:hypothetical protein
MNQKFSSIPKKVPNAKTGRDIHKQFQLVDNLPGEKHFLNSS